MPVYEEKEKIDGKKRYYIRTYIIDEFGKKKQITKHNKEWIGNIGKELALTEERQLKNKVIMKSISFEELCRKFLNEIKNSNKESTYYTYYKLIEKWVIPYFQNKKLNDLTLNNFILWRNLVLEQKMSLVMKNKCHTIMVNILNYAFKYNLIQQNFEKNLGTFKEKNEEVVENSNIRYITYQQFNQFINVVDDIDWYVFFTFLYYTGMRKGEVQALSWDDIDFENKTIYVTKSLTAKTFEGPYKITNTKTGENRKVDMSKHLYEVLEKYYKLKKDNLDFSNKDFVFGGKKPLARATIDRNKNKYFNKSKLEPITIHEFRHSHVSLIVNEAIKENIDMLNVFIMLSERMGHTIEVMQKVYLHLFPNIQTKVINIIDNLDSQKIKQD